MNPIEFPNFIIALKAASLAQSTTIVICFFYEDKHVLSYNRLFFNFEIEANVAMILYMFLGKCYVNLVERSLLKLLPVRFEAGHEHIAIDNKMF